jgi:hypothetical protein
LKCCRHVTLAAITRHGQRFANLMIIEPGHESCEDLQLAQAGDCSPLSLVALQYVQQTLLCRAPGTRVTMMRVSQKHLTEVLHAESANIQ